MIVQLETYRIGSRIRISSGPLCGLTGEVAYIFPDTLKCVLIMDGMPAGAYLTVSADILAVEIDE